MSGYLGVVPVILLEVAFLVVVGLMTRGRIRVLGLGAGALWLLSTLLHTLAIPFLYTQLDLPPRSIGLVASLFGILDWAAMVLVAIALVLAARAEAARPGGGEGHRPQGQGPNQPWGQGQPSQHPGQPPEQQRPW